MVNALRDVMRVGITITGTNPCNNIFFIYSSVCLSVLQFNKLIFISPAIIHGTLHFDTLHIVSD